MTGIALEGGAERSAFTAGVLDALMERDFYAAAVSGTSAGAGCMLNYRSGQQGIALNMMIMERKQRYFGISHMLSKGKFLDLEHMTHTYANLIQWDAYQKHNMQTYLVATCCETGKPAYLTDKGIQNRLFTALKASCALPIICKPVTIDGKHYIDGSIVDPISFSPLLEKGCSKVIVVLTGKKGSRPTNYKPFRPLLYPIYYSKYPHLYKAIMNRIPKYYQQLREIEVAQTENRILILRPEIDPIPLFTQDPQKIRSYYQHGLEIVEKKWNQICAFLESPIIQNQSR